MSEYVRCQLEFDDRFDGPMVSMNNVWSYFNSPDVVELVSDDIRVSILNLNNWYVV